MKLCPVSKQAESALDEMLDLAVSMSLAPVSKQAESALNEMLDLAVSMSTDKPSVKRYAESFSAPKKRPVLVKNLSSKKDSQEAINETARYLYDLSENRYFDWLEKLTKYSLRKNLVKTEFDAEDLASSFLAWFVQKDKLEGRTHEPVMYHWIQGQMFVQWVQRMREKQGQDVLSRQRSKYCRTQQERKVGGYSFSPETTASTAIVSTDESGNVTDRDFYFSDGGDDPYSEAEREEKKRLIFEAFSSSAESEEEKAMLHKVYQEMVEKTFKSDADWAQDWALDVSTIREYKKRVKGSLLSCDSLREYA